jgi:hypothetical protein
MVGGTIHDGFFGSWQTPESIMNQQQQQQISRRADDALSLRIPLSTIPKHTVGPNVRPGAGSQVYSKNRKRQDDVHAKF